MTAADGKKENEIAFNKEKIFSNQIDNVMQNVYIEILLENKIQWQKWISQ